MRVSVCLPVEAFSCNGITRHACDLNCFKCFQLEGAIEEKRDESGTKFHRGKRRGVVFSRDESRKNRDDGMIKVEEEKRIKES